MAIDVMCPGCGKAFQAPDSAAGRRGRCKACGTHLRVPDPSVPYDDQDADSDDSQAAYPVGSRMSQSQTSIPIVAQPIAAASPQQSPSPIIVNTATHPPSYPSSRSPSQTPDVPWNYVDPIRPAARVIVTDFDVKFGSLVWLMVKLAFASIPAAIIIGIIWAMIGFAFLVLIRVAFVGLS